MNTRTTSGDVQALARGLGVAEALRRLAGSWTVAASFPRATYVGTPGRMFVVAARSVPRGPTYLTVDAPEVFVPPGTGATMSGSHIQLGRFRIEGWESADVWIGDTPDRIGLGRHREVAIACLSSLAQESALQTEPFSRAARLAMAALERGQLPDVCQILLGVGPGLTPAGDDALVGMLITARFLGGPTDALTLPIAGSTSPLSVGFVRWAARGQAIAPIHTVLTAAAAGNEARCEAAVAELARMGATSGADCAFGIAAALRSFDTSRQGRPITAGTDGPTAVAGESLHGTSRTV